MTIEEIERGIRFLRTEDKEPTAYAILINGRRFKTQKGKSVWKQRNHATTALRFDVEPKLQRMVKTRIMSEPNYDGKYYSNPEYRNCFNDFKEYLLNNSIMEIIKLSE